MKYLIIFSFLALFAGCATVPQVSVENYQGPVPVNSGVVIAQTLTNSTRITGPITIWDELIIWRDSDVEGQKNTFSLKSLSRNTEAQQYAGVIPAGTYRLGMLYAYLSVGDVNYWAKVLTPPALGTFEVKAGQVTNLGEIIYHPFQSRSRNTTLMPDYAVTRTPSPELWQLMLPNLPANVAALDTSSALTWKESAFEEVVEPFATEKMRLSASATKIHHINGNYLLTGRLGLVKAIDQWRASQTMRVIHDAVAAGEDAVLVGGEFGTLLRFANNGDLLTRYEFLAEHEHVYDLARVSDQQALVVTLKGKEFLLYLLDFESGAAKEIARHPRKEGNMFTLPSSPIIAVFGDVIKLYMDGKTQQYDVTAGVWQEAVKSSRYSDVYQQRNGVWVAVPSSAWALGALAYRYSTDGGESWKTFGSGSYDLYLFNDGEAIKMGSDSDYSFWQGRQDKDAIDVLSSADHGKTWKTVGTLPTHCPSIDPKASSDESLVALCEDGQVRLSTDRGQTWKLISESTSRPFDEFPGIIKYRYER